MAYMNQEQKKEIAKMLKSFMPKSWKYSLSVDNLSTIVLTIREADVDLLEILYQKSLKEYQRSVNAGMYHPEPVKRAYSDVYHKHIESYFEGEVLQLFRKIVACLNFNNYDNSDAMTDYFDVGHYVRINIGKFNKPFTFKPKEEQK